MKLTNTFLLLAAGFSLAACSSDDDVPNKVPSDEAISFNASAPLAPRAVITTETLKDFRVTAYTGGQKFMDNVKVTKVGNSWTYSPTMYWPVDQTVNFFSYAPGEGGAAPGKTSGDGTDLNFTNTGSVDLLYGVNMNLSGETEQMVNINFRHALSQVRLALRHKAETPAIRVDVIGIDLLNIKSTGDFDFPRETTSMGSTSKGTWRNQGSPENPVLFKADQAWTLTDNYDERNSSSYFFFVPQTLTPSKMSGTSPSGSIARVLCAIYHEDTGAKIWPSKSIEFNGTGCGYIYFPLDAGGNEGAVSEWEAGRAYVYNLTIGIPSTSSAIQFDVTVDEYQDFAQIPLDNDNK